MCKAKTKMGISFLGNLFLPPTPTSLTSIADPGAASYFRQLISLAGTLSTALFV